MYIYILCDIIITGIIIIVIYIYTLFEIPRMTSHGLVEVWFMVLAYQTSDSNVHAGWLMFNNASTSATITDICIYIYSNHPKIHMWHGQKMEV